MEGIVSLLCAATSAACAILLLRAFRQSGVRLLLWTGLCFIGLCLNNLLLFADIRLPAIDLFVIRSIPALVGVLLLLYGLIWEGK